MKKIACFFIVLVLVFVGVWNTGKAKGLEETLNQTAQAYMQGVDYDGRLYISRGLFDDREASRLANEALFKIVNSQFAIMELMDFYRVEDTVFIDEDIKGSIINYYNSMIEGYEDIRFGAGSDRFSSVTDLAYKRFLEDSSLKVDFNSKKSKKAFYGRIHYANQEWLDLLETY